MLEPAALWALGLAICGCVIGAYWYPLTATLLCCVAISAEAHYFPAGRYGLASGVVLLAAFVLSYQLGSRTTLPHAVLGVVPLIVCWQISGGLDPFPAVDALGPCAVGVLVRSRTAARAELEVTGRELAREQELFAAESVRYERARIARELHDIVAHCVSVMVVQAGAGRYLLEQDFAGAVQALDAITESATAAEAEISRLVSLLDRTTEESRSIDDLVRRARATGLAIGYRSVGDCDVLTSAVYDVAYRVVQEAVTNALKHAPGAPIDIRLDCSAAGLCIEVTNGASLGASLELATSGGGHGIAGMRERATACGGSLTAGPDPAGGWRIAVELPAESSTRLSS
jgi:signal transduction histidine kinase